MPIEKLQAAGINVADINKLRESGIYSVGMLAKTTSRALTAIKGFSDAKVAKIRDATRKLDDKPVFKSACLQLFARIHSQLEAWPPRGLALPAVPNSHPCTRTHALVSPLPPLQTEWRRCTRSSTLCALLLAAKS